MAVRTSVLKQVQEAGQRASIKTPLCPKDLWEQLPSHVRSAHGVGVVTGEGHLRLLL